MHKKTYSSLPAEFAACQYSDCPLSADCLHFVAYPQLMETQTYIRLINPKLCTKDEDCQFYRSAKPVLYARGFTNVQKCLLPEQYQRFMTTLIGRFGRNGYFDRRRGLTALSPAEQETVLAALAEVGFHDKIAFDNYEELTNYFD